MTGQITVVGIGMGSAGTLTPEAREEIGRCDCLIGASRMLEPFLGLGVPAFSCSSNQGIAAYIKEHPEFERICVAVSGDTGFYSAAKGLRELLSDLPVRMVCGVSSLSYFCAELGTSWEDAKLISLHGRKRQFVGAVSQNKKTFFLTSADFGPHRICRELAEFGLGGLSAAVGENLGGPSGRITRGTVRELSKRPFSGLSVMLVENPSPTVKPMMSGGLSDGLFERGEVPMTKSEVRAVCLARLQIQSDSVLYDIGAGTGSASVEMALLAADGMVYAVEKNPDAVVLIKKNRERFGAYNMKVIEAAAPDGLKALPAPDRALIGGSSGNLGEIIAELLRKNPRVRLAVTAVTLETLGEALRLFEENGLEDLEVSQVSVSRARPVGSYHMMMGQNPVFVISGEGRDGL